MGHIKFSGTSDHNGSPSHSVSGMPARRSTNSSRRHAHTPEKQSKKQYFDVDSVSSSSVSNKIVDRYIDGEEQQERSRLMNSSQTNHTSKANGQSRRPPRFQHTAPTLPADSIKDKPKCHSFREVKGVPLNFATRQWTDRGFGHGSPRILAKNVVERLSQCHVLPKPNRKSFESDLSALIRKIRNLVDKKISYANEVSDLLKCRLADQASAKEDMILVKEELHWQTRKFERERNEIQSRLEKELDRRSSDWSYKVEKYQSEVQRLRERVRELSEQKSLQREVSSFNERDTRVEEVSKENQGLKHTLADLQDIYKGAEEDNDCLHKHYEEKDKECQELHKSITRLLRTCNEQGKTIGSLREDLSEKIEKSSEKVNRHIKKMQLEESRLTGVEQALRRVVESYRVEVDSLRREYIDLLNCLKGYMKEGSFSTVKLDQELRSHICFLQDQGLKMLKESMLLCSKLQDLVKGKTDLTINAQQGVNSVKRGLDRQFVIECATKIQGLKQGTESLERSLQTMSVLHHEKANLIDCNSQSSYAEGSLKMTASEDILRSELKAEILLTRILREKMYFKEQEVEQLQAELAAAVRGNDILKSEVQNALDELSSATHKLKNLEIEEMPKREYMENQDAEEPDGFIISLTAQEEWNQQKGHDVIDWTAEMVYDSDTGVCRPALNPVRNQRNYPYCWALAASYLHESVSFFLGFDILRQLSPQHLINNCQPFAIGLNGERKFNLTVAMEYIRDHGIPEEEDCPFTGRRGKCIHEQVGCFRSAGFQQIPDDENFKITEIAVFAVLRKHPVGAAIHVNDYFPYLQDGVYFATECHEEESKKYLLNHAVVVVGYGVTKTGGYLKFANSHGTDWGVNGIGKVCLNSKNPCGYKTIGRFQYPIYIDSDDSETESSWDS